MGKKGVKKRYIFGWNNYTEFENAKIQEVKEIIKREHNLDFDIIKPYGPRANQGIFIPGT